MDNSPSATEEQECPVSPDTSPNDTACDVEGTERLGETRVDIGPHLDIIVSYQVDVDGNESQLDTTVQKHIENDMNHVVEENEDLQVVKKRDVDFIGRMERKPKLEQPERRGSVSTTLTEYGSTITTSFTNTVSGGYNLVRRNTIDRLPPELRSVRKFKKSTNAIVRKTLQIQMDDDDDEEEEEEEEEEPIPANVEKKEKKEKKRRTVNVYANDRAKNKSKRRRWPSNYIRTTKYRWWSFIPQNLFEQFRRIHNIYFLITLIVQLIPAVSPVVPTSSILPFCIIIILTALKDLYEDLMRYRADRKANNKPCYVLRDGDLQRIPSKNLEVGDIVRVDRDDTLCADVVCLSTSREDGACYIDTAQLDGETSLKTRRSVKTTHYMGNDPLQYKAMKGKLTVEAPSANLDKFNGRLKSKLKNDQEKQISSLDMNNLLLRGCTLRNTKFAYGIVIYVGEETKLFKNLKISVAKFSHLDKRLNYLTILMIFVQQAVCWFFTGISYWFQASYTLNNPYMSPIYVTNGVVQNVPTFIVLSYMTFFSLTGMLLPMGLFLALEFIKTAQSKYIEFDPGMKHGDVSMQVKTSHLNQGLSQLDIIFSDKTGTLTCNEMHFAKAWIDGTYYDEMKYPKSIMTYMLKHVPNFALMSSESRHEHPHWFLCQEFLMCLLLNHSVIPEMDEKTNEIVYDGLSSDEIALLTTARNNGFKLLQRTNAGLQVEIHGTQMFVEILAQLDFTSDRKRMTVAVKIPQISDEILVYSKGADTVMVKLLKEEEGIEIINMEKKKKRKSILYTDVQNALDQLGNEGLRTLIMCKRQVPQDQFMEWLNRYNEANSLVGGRESAVAKVALELECDFEVLGCTAIEDRLQEEVPESVQYLLDAGLQVWMLTGDKTETAINIAYSANVLRKGKTIEIRIRDPKSQRHFEKKLQVALEFLEKADDLQAEDLDFALIIDCKAIKYSLLPNFEKDFIKIIQRCKSAICCRCTPKQKAAIVKLVETAQNKRSLAVGDGVNDVAMIQAATIGVGIMGREGSQAARASDYAIPRFRHLVRLIAVHGRYSYIRNSDYLHLSFYKNNALVFMQLIFNFFDGFTGGVLYDSWTITMYNTIFAQIPPLMTGVFEKDLEPETILKHPELYSQLKNDALFNMKTFTLWQIIPMVHAVMLYFGVYFASTGESVLGVENDDLYVSGTIVMTCMLSVILLRHALETKYFTWITHSVFWFCYITYFIWGILYNVVPHFPTFFVSDNYNYYWFFFKSFSSLKAFLIHPLLIVACLLPDFTFKFIKRHLNPDTWEYLLLQEKGLRPKPFTTSAVMQSEEEHAKI